MDPRLLLDTVTIGDVLGLSFHRTLRVPEDGIARSGLPHLGTVPIRRVDDFITSVPPVWRQHGGFFVCLFQCEALCVRFTCASLMRPVAVKVGIGNVNALSGKPFTETLVATGPNEDPDYLVCPSTSWLDCVSSGSGSNSSHQMVALPFGPPFEQNLSMLASHELATNGIQFVVYAQKQSQIPPQQASPDFGSSSLTFAQREMMNLTKNPIYSTLRMLDAVSSNPSAAPLEQSSQQQQQQQQQQPVPMESDKGLTAGGPMSARIQPDRFGIDSWDQSRSGRVVVHVVNTQMFERICGVRPPPTPLYPALFAQFNVPWIPAFEEGSSTAFPLRIQSSVPSFPQAPSGTPFFQAPTFTFPLPQQPQQQPQQQIEFPVVSTSFSQFDVPIEVCVGGITFVTTSRTLCSIPSRLVNYFDPITGAIKPNQPTTRDRWLFIDRDGNIFHFILDYLRNFPAAADYLPSDASSLRRLLAESRFFDIKPLIQLCSDRLASLPNSGAESPHHGMNIRLIKAACYRFHKQLCAVDNFPDSLFQKRVIPYSEISFEVHSTPLSPKPILITWFIGDAAGNFFVDINNLEENQTLISQGIQMPNMPLQYGMSANIRFIKMLNPGLYTVRLKWTPFMQSKYIINGPLMVEVYELPPDLFEERGGSFSW